MDRPLDGLERRLWLLGRAVSVNVVATARVRGVLREREVRGALDAAQARHPQLRLCIDEGPPPRFVGGAPAPALRVVPRDRGDAWRAAAEEDLGQRFPSTPGPLLRATLVHGGEASELILACHHAIGDGFALFSLMGEVLSYAAGEPPGPSLGAEPPLSALVPADARGLAARIAFAREAQRLASEARLVRAEGLRRDRATPPAERRSRIVQRALDAQGTQALAARARQARTTVQGALAAAALRAVREDAGRDLGLGCQQSVYLGTRLGRPPPEAFGVYALGVPTYHRVGAQEFWSLARETRTALEGLLERRTPLLAPAYLEATIPRDAAAAGDVVERADGLDLAAVAVTNLGRIDPPALPGLCWETFHFGSAVGLGNVLMLATTTFRGALTCNFITPDPLVGPARAERLADAAMANLRTAP